MGLFEPVLGDGLLSSLVSFGEENSLASLGLMDREGRVMG